MSDKQKLHRGFAVIGVEQRKEIASQGGKTAHALGRAHKWTPEEARAAALKGAETRRRNAKKQPQE